MKLKMSDLVGKGSDEIDNELMKLFREQFDLKMALGTGQLSQVHLLKQVRRNIARIKTLRNNKGARQP